jgi:hypothetical protein
MWWILLASLLMLRLGVGVIMVQALEYSLERTSSLEGLFPANGGVFKTPANLNVTGTAEIVGQWDNFGFHKDTSPEGKTVKCRVSREKNGREPFAANQDRRAKLNTIPLTT